VLHFLIHLVLLSCLLVLTILVLLVNAWIEEAKKDKVGSLFSWPLVLSWPEILIPKCLAAHCA
jgi:hypothetical protein